MRKQRFMDQSTLVCPVCHNTFPIMRNHGQHRKRGHIKDLWCPFCKAERKMVEARDFVMTMSGERIYI